MEAPRIGGPRSTNAHAEARRAHFACPCPLVAALPAIGTPEEVGRKEEAGQKQARQPLSEREQKLAAILGKMTAETMEPDREAILAVLLGWLAIAREERLNHASPA